jgi:epoxyqueuosine reductase
MTFTQELKQKAIDVGFVSVGVSNPNTLRDLPHGRIHSRYNLRSPEEELPNVKSVILMAFNAWDKAFDLQVDSTNLQNREMHTIGGHAESYQLYYEVMKNKAWMIADYLKKRGFESLYSLGIPLKTSAVRCGLGCQGKNTLLITPSYGPRVRLISVLTTAELDTDEPCKEDLCGNCEKCVVACPTKALEPHKLRIDRCMTYSAENSLALDVPEDVKKQERRLIQRPTSCSYIECTICIQACPIGKLNLRQTQQEGFVI